ncbi:MAG: ATP-dependent DNA ligase LigA [Haloarculaceae archaeon]
MEFAAFAERARRIERESADLEIVAHVVDCFEAAGADLPTVVRFLLGRAFPAHDSRTLDVGPSLCHAAIAKAAGPNVDADDVERRLAVEGDVGAVAASYDLGGQQGLAAFADGDRESLTVADVEGTLHRLAAADGSGSQETKLDALFGLFTRAGDDEARYLARLVLSEMRIGVGEGAVRDAVAEAFDVPVDAVERALQVSNDYGHVARVARESGADGLTDVHLEVGRPVQAMLAQAGTVADALDSWGTVGVETKYDGARVQVHYDGTDASLYSRNMEDVTDPLPEIVDFVESALDRPAILDGEVVAVDDDGRPQPFQQVLRRFRRKHDVAQAREEVTLELHVFDCLHAGDGDGGDAAARSTDARHTGDLLDAPLTTRHDRLMDLLGEHDDAVADLRLCEDAEEIEAMEATALQAGHEGLMLKNPESAYTPGDRGQNWLKRKPDVETLDLVVTGAEWGEGRRATLLGTFLLSVRTGDGYETIGKVATGITDEELEALTALLEPHVRSETGTEVDVEPAVVFEVGYEEIQSSPTYSSGYALRFPRFLGVREDKDPGDADTLDRVQRLADRQ